ncbi:MAG: glycerate kinase [Gammaproteobacteria bacterium]
MKIVIAPDSFKGNMTSLEVATLIAKGIRRVMPKAKCISIPMADGGEGTVQSLIDAKGGKFIHKTVRGPAGRSVNARYGILTDTNTAVIEMAEASGLPLARGADRNPLRTTTYGTGELIIDAIEKGVDEIIIGIGGSATIDAGCGMAQALGVRFLNENGHVIRQKGAGGMLDRIVAIDMNRIHPGVAGTKITIASDVDNTLYGKKGAAYVFGPQKGASVEMVKRLDANLRHFAKVIKKELGQDLRGVKGAGAAGGLGAGLVVFAGAKIKSGVDIIIKATGLKDHIKGADLVITGEGRVDFQTAYGKTPAGVARLANKHKVPVIAIGGCLADDAAGVFEHGIDGLSSAAARDMSQEEAIRMSRAHLVNAAERTMRLLLVGRSLEMKSVKKR